MFRGFVIWVALLACFVQPFFAQSITGKVVNQELTPIPYVSCVLLKLPDSTFVAGATSSMDGCFELAVPEGSYVLKLSYIGYKAKELECSSGDLGTIVLEEDVRVLDEVVVKGEAPLVTMENNRLTYHVEPIMQQKIVGNAHELLKELPSVISLDGNTLSLVGASSTTICISGKKSHLNMEQLTDYLKSLPVEEVKKVEVLYNAPPQWHVKGAVINVVLKKKKNYTLNGQIRGEWANQHRNSYSAGGTVIVSTPKWDFDIIYKFADQQSVDKTEMSGIHTVKDAAYEIFSTTKNYDKGNKHSIYASVRYKIDEEQSVDFSYNGQISPETTSRSYSRNSMFSDANSINVRDNNLHNLALSYTSQKGISAGVEYTNYADAGTQDMEVYSGDSFQQAFSYWRKQYIDRVTAYLDMSHNLKHNWVFNYGANYNYVNNRNEQRNEDLAGSGENDYTRTLEIDEHTAVAYVGFLKSFWEGKLSLDASLSGELYKYGEYEKNALLPNVGVTFVPSQKHVFQLGYHTLRTYPTYWQKQDYTSYADEYTVYMGNPLLKPARTSNVDLTYVLKNKYVFQVSYYRVNDFFIDQSYQMPDELRLLYKSFNIDYTSSLNFTSVVPVRIGKWFSSNLIFSAYNEKYKSNDWYGYQYDRSKWTGTAMANSTFIVSRKPRLSVNLMVFYRTPTIQGIWDLESNWGINAGIRYSFLKNCAILSLQCNDLFETIYPKTKVRFESQYQDVNESAYRRSVTLSFTYKFKGYKNKQYKEVDTSRFGIQ